jgi:5-(carboxyamino)imidazole ribonucleotide synthase
VIYSLKGILMDFETVYNFGKKVDGFFEIELVNLAALVKLEEED